MLSPAFSSSAIFSQENCNLFSDNLRYHYVLTAYRLCFRNHMLDHPLSGKVCSCELPSLLLLLLPLPFAGFQNGGKPSGDRMDKRNAQHPYLICHPAKARAPPLPPSPITTESTGTVRPARQCIEIFAMASPCPRSLCFQPAECALVYLLKADHRTVKFSCLLHQARDLQYPSGDTIWNSG